jgi:hypothetical protein
MKYKAHQIISIMAETDKNYAAYYDVIPNLIKERGYKTGIEIGVFAGGHAERILNSGIDKLYGVDPYKMYNPGMPGLESQEDWNLLHDFVMLRLKGENYIHYRYESNTAFNMLKNKLFDFVFIDGLHTYEQLKQDLENYNPLVKKGGIIACHDYAHPYFPELTTCINEFSVKHNTDIVACPLHLIYMEKTW